MILSLHRQTITVVTFLAVLSDKVQATSVRIETEVNVNAASVQALTPTVDQFRTALGSLNANAPVNNDRNGRRQINWDAAPDSIADPNDFPGDFFNFNAEPRARGIEFSPVGDTASFKLSSTEASGQPVNFGRGFIPFSPERLFATIGGTTFDVKFFDPANQEEAATSRGLGVVFQSAQVPGASKMVFYDIDDNVLAEREVSTRPSSAGFSFTGLIFNEAVVAKVRITSGNLSIDAASSALSGAELGVPGILQAIDVVVMDDFIFGEPIPIAQCGFFCKLVKFFGGVIDFFF